MEILPWVVVGGGGGIRSTSHSHCNKRKEKEDWVRKLMYMEVEGVR